MYFEIVESAIFKLIENQIKEKDKSLEYSNKKSEIEDAQLFKKFSTQVLSSF
jgi:hypothetical protein